MVLKMSLSMRKIWVNSQAGRIGRTIANGSPPQQRIFGAALPRRYKPRGRAPPLVTALWYYSESNETSIMKLGFNFIKKCLCAAIVTADTPYLRKLLLYKCFTVASLTKMQFKQNASEKFDFRYCCIAS